jgi:hypothetical protein
MVEHRHSEQARASTILDETVPPLRQALSSLMSFCEVVFSQENWPISEPEQDTRREEAER